MPCGSMEIYDPQTLTSLPKAADNCSKECLRYKKSHSIPFLKIGIKSIFYLHLIKGMSIPPTFGRSRNAYKRWNGMGNPSQSFHSFPLNSQTREQMEYPLIIFIPFLSSLLKGMASVLGQHHHQIIFNKIITCAKKKFIEEKSNKNIIM